MRRPKSADDADFRRAEKTATERVKTKRRHRLLTLTLSSVEEERETGWGVSPDVWMRLEVRSPRR